MAMISSALITRYFSPHYLILGSCVFSVDHTVARLYLYRYFFTVYDLTATYCDNLCLLGFSLELSGSTMPDAVLSSVSNILR